MPNFYHPFDETLRGDNPWPIFRRMRDEAPAYFVEELNTWFLSRFEDVWAASTDRTHYTANMGTTLYGLVGLWPPPPRAMVHDDPPEHSHSRGAISPLYQKVSVDKLEQKLREMVRTLLAPSLQKGELEVNQLTTALALHNIAEFIGLEYADVTHIRSLLSVYLSCEPGIRGPTPKGNQAMGEIAGFCMQLIQGFRTNLPAENTHAHAWVTSGTDGRQLNDEEIFMNLFSIILTSSDTVPSMCAGTIYYLSEHPEQYAAVRGDHSLLTHAFAETVRYDHPTNMLGRRVVKDFELHGESIHTGQNVMWLFSSANRDEREFPDADQYQISRRARRTLSFGAGIHACMGHHLARLQGKIVLEEIFNAIPEYEVQKHSCKRAYSDFLKGYCHVPITFRPR